MDITTQAQTGFEGCTKDDLRGFLTSLGEAWHPAEKERTLKNKILAKLGLPPIRETDTPALDSVTSAGDKSPFGDKWDLVPPFMQDKLKTELNPWGWAGKMYEVEVSSHIAAEKTFHVSWEGWPINLLLNKRVHVPAPHYNRLVEHVTHQVIQEEVRNARGDVSYEKKMVPWRQFMVQLYGIVQGTEDKPSDMREYYRAFAKARENFVKLKRGQLATIHSSLFPDYPPKDKQALTDEQLRTDILIFLGVIEDEQLEAVA